MLLGGGDAADGLQFTLQVLVGDLIGGARKLYCIITHFNPRDPAVVPGTWGSDK